ncbi:MAG TPA: LuxR C-terminal-related transcriptional regulator [Cyclobacteriaceae bacterium]|nr:LuxR C-terminal-related transcriptional regulator [Cyclobacteriaceae bacterium]
MKRTIFMYGVAMAVFIIALRYFEYRLFVRDLSLEFYVGIVAIFFTTLGVWAGLRLTRKKINVASADIKLDEDALVRLGISKREKEVLDLIASGLSNQEIADKLFVSLNTVKTHSSNLFQKLAVRRRTQAIQRAKELRLIP